MSLVNKRQNPIDSSTSPVTITDEAHTVAEFTELPGVYGFYLEERPVSGTVSVREDNTAETPFTIVSAAPSPGQVFIDYNSNRGMLIFNISDNATAVIVTYNGLGTNQTVENTKKIALETPLDDYVVGANSAIANTDTLYEALGKVQGQIDASGAGVADQIHAATAKNPPVDADELGLADSAASWGLKKLTFGNLFLWIITKVAALTAKTTPVDADGFAIIDSEASNVGKFLSFTNLKAFLKTYFDTLYAPVTTGWTVAWDTFAGIGGTDTKILYFTNKNTDTSSGDLTIVNNSTNGLRLTIVSDGVYAISHSLAVGGASLVFGLSLNSNQLTTDIGSITAANRLAIATINIDYSSTVAVTLPLSAGDVIRPHFGAGAGNAATYAALASFRIARIR